MRNVEVRSISMTQREMGKRIDEAGNGPREIIPSKYVTVVAIGNKETQRWLGRTTRDTNIMILDTECVGIAW
jgi:hypothetical protein